MIIGKAITAGGSGKSYLLEELPEGYKRLEYIEATGTQYIDTGFKATNNTRVLMDFELIDKLSGTVHALFGARQTATSNVYIFLWTGSRFRSYYNTAYKEIGEAEVSGRRIIDQNKEITNFDGSSIAYVNSEFETPNTLKLLASDNAGSMTWYASAKLYSCKIYDNDVLIRNFIPCVNSSGEIGLYDFFNGEFYGNAGSGSFIAGNEIAAPKANGIACVLTVTTAEGALVETTLGSKKVSATATAEGKAVFILGEEGLWTISATLDGETKSTEVLVEHNVEENLTFFPQEPSSYEQLALITASQTWTAPENGYFQIEVFGASGNGGIGTGYANSSKGGGGGGGGYSASRMALNKGDTIVLTIGVVGSTTKAVIDSSHDDTYDHTIQVTSGTNGKDGSSLTGAGPGGTGGTASGGNYANADGGAGEDGGAGGEAGHTGGNVGGDGVKSKTANPGSAGFVKIYRGNTN